MPTAIKCRYSFNRNATPSLFFHYWNYFFVNFISSFFWFILQAYSFYFSWNVFCIFFFVIVFCLIPFRGFILSVAELNGTLTPCRRHYCLKSANSRRSSAHGPARAFLSQRYLLRKEYQKVKIEAHRTTSLMSLFSSSLK